MPERTVWQSSGGPEFGRELGQREVPEESLAARLEGSDRPRHKCPPFIFGADVMEHRVGKNAIELPEQLDRRGWRRDEVQHAYAGPAIVEPGGGDALAEDSQSRLGYVDADIAACASREGKSNHPYAATDLEDRGVPVDVELSQHVPADQPELESRGAKRPNARNRQVRISRRVVVQVADELMRAAIPTAGGAVVHVRCAPGALRALRPGA